MKKIKYLFNGRPKVLLYSEKTIEIAQSEAENGEYEIFDDGKPAPVKMPTDKERIAALEAAMLEMLGVTING